MKAWVCRLFTSLSSSSFNFAEFFAKYFCRYMSFLALLYAVFTEQCGTLLRIDVEPGWVGSGWRYPTRLLVSSNFCEFHINHLFILFIHQPSLPPSLLDSWPLRSCLDTIPWSSYFAPTRYRSVSTDAPWGLIFPATIIQVTIYSAAPNSRRGSRRFQRDMGAGLRFLRLGGKPNAAFNTTVFVAEFTSILDSER